MMFHRQLILGLVAVTALCGCRGFGWMNRNDYASLHDPFLEQPVAPGASTNPRDPAVVRMDQFPASGSDSLKKGIVRLDSGRSPHESSAGDAARRTPGYSPWEDGNGPSLTDFIGKGSVPAASLATAGSAEATSNPFAESAANALRTPVAAVEGIADRLSQRATAFVDSAAAATGEMDHNAAEAAISFSKWAEQQSQTVAAAGATVENQTVAGIETGGNSFSTGARSVSDLQDTSVSMAEVDRLMAETDAAVENAAQNASRAVANAPGVTSAVFLSPPTDGRMQNVVPVGMTTAETNELAPPVPDRFNDSAARSDDQNPIPRPAFESDMKRYPMPIVPSTPVPAAVVKNTKDPGFADFPAHESAQAPDLWSDSTTTRGPDATLPANSAFADGATPLTTPRPPLRAATTAAPAVSPAAMEFDTGWKPFLN